MSLIEPAAAPSHVARGELHVGGVSLARHQLGLFLALGCERIVCVAVGPHPEVLSLQHVAEQAGARFHLIDSARALAGLVSAQDDIVVIAEGLLAAPGDVVRLLGSSHAVLVQPVEEGLAAGFERIDLATASAGAMRVPGGLVARLVDLPPDFDVFSALQRIALQAGVAQRPLEPAGDPAFARWQLVRGEDEAHAIEAAWLGEQIGASRTKSLGCLVARFAARRFGPALLHGRGGGRTLGWASWILLMLGLGAGWFDQTGVAIGLLGVGWIIHRAAGYLSDVTDRALMRVPQKVSFSKAYDWLFDLGLILLLGWRTAAPELAFPAEKFFAPAMLLAVLRLTPRANEGGWTAWLEDRAVLCAVLVSCVVAGVATPAVPLLTLLVALGGILAPRMPVRLTPA